MLKTFPIGGTHPPDRKLTAAAKMAHIPVPAMVIIPLSQHIGAPALPVVEKGETVKTGQLIAKADGYVSANIHSPVSGKVNRIDLAFDSTGYRKKCIIIDTEGDEWIETIDRDPSVTREIKLSREEIIAKCLEAGIVGMGGASFPTHVKLTIPVGKRCDLLIINGVECEPYLTSDHRLMLEKGEAIMTGTTILMKALGVEKAIIGIENNKPDAISHLKGLSLSFSGITVQALKVKYPQGGEKQLVKALIDKDIPSGGLPIDVHTMVQNIGTAYAVYEAVQKNKPLFERVVTVTGESLKQPSNFIARIGTPVSKLIEAAGGLPGDTGKIINGGPMMGKALNNIDVPVVKGMSGIVILRESESERRRIDPCIRCAKCINACFFNLEPYLLMTLTEKALLERAEKERITDCCECGSCAFACPAGRPLLDYIRLGKSSVLKIIRERNIK
ncbi:MAG: electron transport complex subunit RsxC [Odoribacter sp.]|nr:electron transport complex subunit RsxC [Odoribacter sp.]